jgi:regulator of protease activity HflC (stomatin/prohibitin superfamily)
MEEKYNIPVMKIILAVLCCIIFFNTITIISAGERGIVVTLGNPSDNYISEGINFKIPFFQKIVKIDIKTQKYEVLATSVSSDLQTVTTEVTINYHLSEDSIVNIYKTIGLDYQNKIVQPAVQEAIKSSTAKYNAEELITKRSEVRELIKSTLEDRLSKKGMIVDEISITNFDFSESFNRAIEDKVTAEQNALQSKNKLEQVKYEAEQRITEAKAEAEAIKIQAEAITSQGGKEYVQLQAINKWNGVLPTVTGNAIPFINLNMTQE